MKTQYVTYDGKIFVTHGAAQDHEDKKIKELFAEGALAMFGAGGELVFKPCMAEVVFAANDEALLACREYYDLCGFDHNSGPGVYCWFDSDRKYVCAPKNLPYYGLAEAFEAQMLWEDRA